MPFPALTPTLALMAGFSHPWCFGGGWAIDGFIGHVTRPHSDVDVVIWRTDQHAMRTHFKDWEWQTFNEGAARPWPASEFLELPFHNAHGTYKGQALEVLMLEKDRDSWWFRRNPIITMPADRAMLPTAHGFKVLNPAIALLFKSKRLEAKDNDDFENVLPFMAATDRAWLKESLTLMYPAHGWIKNL